MKEVLCSSCGASSTKVRTILVTMTPSAIVAMVDEVTCSCGEVVESWERMGEAYDLAARLLLLKPRALAAGEVKFLRKLLGWKGNELAARMGVTPSSMSRWESGVVPILPLADRALRSFVAIERHIPLELSELARIDATDASPLEAVIELTAAGWLPARPSVRKSRKAS